MALRSRVGWGRETEFHFSACAFLLSPVSLWKFSIVLQQNGGVAFFIPYTLCLVTLGLPLLYLELSLGQFMQKAGPRAWDVLPLSKGLSVTGVLVSLIKISNHLILASWCSCYLYLILTNQVTTCLTQLDASSDMGNVHELLQVSDSITTPGTVVIHVFIAVLVIILLCFFVVVRGIRWSGKMMYLLAPIPYAGFTTFLVWTVLSGTNLGDTLRSLLVPNFVALTWPETWSTAVRYTLLTLGLGVNVLPSLASYNSLGTSSVRDSLIICGLAVLSNVFASLSIFAVLGDRGNNTYLERDPAFIFVTVTEALSTFPHARVLMFIFFTVIISGAVSSTAVYTETVVSSVLDLSHDLRTWRFLIVIGTLAVCYLFTIPMSMQAGVYVFELFDRVTIEGFILMVVSICQCGTIAWLYGGTRFYDNLQMMTGNRPHCWFKFCWQCLAPAVLLTSFLYQAYAWPIDQLTAGFRYPYLNMTYLLLVLMMVLLVLPIPLVAVWVVCSKHGGCWKKFQSALKPQLKPHQIPLRWRLERSWTKFSRR